MNRDMPLISLILILTPFALIAVKYIAVMALLLVQPIS
jgi:hypothetical protein